MCSIIIKSAVLIYRCDHACTVIGEKFYIFGGSGGENIWFNDLYYFDSGKKHLHLFNHQWRIELYGDLRKRITSEHIDLYAALDSLM